MSAQDSSVRQISEDAPAAQRARSKDVRFNTKTLKTWQQARHACTALQSKTNSNARP
jgi:hypothetical protein